MTNGETVASIIGPDFRIAEISRVGRELRPSEKWPRGLHPTIGCCWLRESHVRRARDAPRAQRNPVMRWQDARR
jgi:hypothetical protein